MASRAELAAQVWSDWGLRMLVLLSFAIQVLLLILAEFRRRRNSSLLKAVVWSCYLMADTTAIYVLGHLSVSSRDPDHQLMAFWAPFLLLHLGGQDNITAYAIEDTRLWLRHLQVLAVQGVAAAYVLYESSVVRTQPRLRRAAILMFVVGFLKYSERVRALSNAGDASPINNYWSIEARKDIKSRIKEMMSPYWYGDNNRVEESSRLKTAHLLIEVPRDFLKGPLPKLKLGLPVASLHMGDLYKVVEMQLSLMHDVFYTKTEVIHGLRGILIRMLSMVATAVALWLFHAADKDGYYNRVDVRVTYVLLVGALVLETMSLVRAMLSSWTWVALEQWHTDAFSCKWLPKLLVPVHATLRWLLRSQDWGRRHWPRRIDQHDLLEMCWCSRASRGSNFAKYFGLEDLWNTTFFSRSIPALELIGELVAAQVDKTRNDQSIASEANEDHIFNSRGRAALHRRELYHDHGSHKGLRFSIDGDGIGLDKSILVWHIATKIYVCWFYKQQQEQQDRLAEAVQALSNYMLHLLAARTYMLFFFFEKKRTYMLPPLNSRNEHVELCYILTNPELQYDSVEDLADLLRCYGDWGAQNPGSDGSRFPRFPSILRGHINTKLANLYSNQTLKKGSMLGAMLIGHEPLQGRLPSAEILDLLAQVWAEMLCYAGYRCTGYYHAKQLTNGGELITVAAILAHYISRAVMGDLSAQQKTGEVQSAATKFNLHTGEVVSHHGTGEISISVLPRN